MSGGPALAVVPGGQAGDASAVSRLAARVASALLQEGARWPALAAACLAARGIAGDLEQAAWATRLALPPAVVEAAESGALAPDRTPAVLVAVADQAWPSWRRWPAAHPAAVVARARDRPSSG